MNVKSVLLYVYSVSVFCFSFNIFKSFGFEVDSFICEPSSCKDVLRLGVLSIGASSMGLDDLVAKEGPDMPDDKDDSLRVRLLGASMVSTSDSKRSREDNFLYRPTLVFNFSSVYFKPAIFSAVVCCLIFDRPVPIWIWSGTMPKLP